jgi:hypothetical protein
MLGLVTGMPTYSYQAFPSAEVVPKAQMKTEFGQRKIHLLNYIKNIALKSRIPAPQLKSLEVINNTRLNFFAAKAFSETIELPLIYFFDFEKDFEITHLNDLVTKDEQWLQAFFDKVNDAIGEKRVPMNARKRELFLKECAWIKANPEKAAYALRFIILHELGHFVDPNKFKNDTLGGGLCLLLLISLIAAGAAIILGVAATASVVIAPIIAIGIAILPGLILTKIVFERIMKPFSLKGEIYADRFAAAAMEGEEGEKIREGGIYFFEFMKSLQLKHSRFDPHPSDDERIHMIQNYQPVDR